MGCMSCSQCEFVGNENPCPLCGSSCVYDEHNVMIFEEHNETMDRERGDE